MLGEMKQSAIELEMERIIAASWNKPKDSCKELTADMNEKTNLIAPMVTWINGYIRGFNSLSFPLSNSVSALQALARTIPQKSTE